MRWLGSLASALRSEMGTRWSSPRPIAAHGTPAVHNARALLPSREVFCHTPLDVVHPCDASGPKSEQRIPPVGTQPWLPLRRVPGSSMAAMDCVPYSPAAETPSLTRSAGGGRRVTLQSDLLRCLPPSLQSFGRDAHGSVFAHRKQQGYRPPPSQSRAREMQIRWSDVDARLETVLGQCEVSRERDSRSNRHPPSTGEPFRLINRVTGARVSLGHSPPAGAWQPLHPGAHRPPGSDLLVPEGGPRGADRAQQAAAGLPPPRAPDHCGGTTGAPIGGVIEGGREEDLEDLEKEYDRDPCVWPL